MPELGEQMYCSQQICIPPTFPYLLRQFAKAAIRTQPNDLLRWATSYFRCLSLNIPPPVKPRLEYPIPKDHCGITPGWLRALHYQLFGNETVSFRVLWDRWIGACLKHKNLIQILCLGGFTDNLAIPWLRFLALCAGHLTENLTQTMILICEILTEEPEGGSAMIPIHIFIDLYRYLASIDASIPQTLRNYYFLDKFLELFRERIARDEGIKEAEPEKEESIEYESTESSGKSEEGSKREEDGTSVISCPSVTEDEDADNFMKLLMKVRGEELEGEGEGGGGVPFMGESEAAITQDLQSEAEVEKSSRRPSDTDEDMDALTAAEKPADDAQEPAKEQVAKVDEPLPADDDEDSVAMTTDGDDGAAGAEELTTKEKCLEEDLKRLRMLHMMDMAVMGGESDDEVEKFKKSLIAAMPLDKEHVEALKTYETKIESDEEIEVASEQIDSVEVKKSKSDVEYEEVFVDSVPGIGPKVPLEIVDTACKYLMEIAKLQHDMVMPRNIRHFECPPLEHIHY